MGCGGMITGIIVTIGIYLLLIHKQSSIYANAAPSGDQISRASLMESSQNHRDGSRDHAKFLYRPVHPSKMKERFLGSYDRVHPNFNVDDFMTDEDDFFDIDMNKRHFDDYGHMRFGKREQSDDYGHLRFGRGDVD